MRSQLAGLVVAIIFLLVWAGYRGSCQVSTIWTEERVQKELQKMVQTLRQYGIKDQRVLEVMGSVRRHLFLPADFASDEAYTDQPLSIGFRQTISQPYIVAYMTERLALNSGEKVLEIGTGSGYQAAILDALGCRVWSIEIIAELASHATRVLQQEGHQVNVRHGDGYLGWPEEAPFDAIIVTCAPAEVPKSLREQVREGGRIILPLSDFAGQRLVILRKLDGNFTHEEDLPVRFVPMVHGQN